MARRRVEFSDIRRMAIGADKTPVPIDGRQFLAKVLPQSLFVVAFGAAGYGHVGLQAPERGCPGDVDMTRRAFGDVVLLFTATFATELDLDSFQRRHRDVRAPLPACGNQRSRPAQAADFSSGS